MRGPNVDPKTQGCYYKDYKLPSTSIESLSTLLGPRTPLFKVCKSRNRAEMEESSQKRAALLSGGVHELWMQAPSISSHWRFFP